MVERIDIKSKHEEAVLDSFASYLDRCGKKLELLCVPEPPDAVVEIDGVKEWIEITDSFHDEAYAQSVTSYAASNKKHRPSGGGCTDPDAYKSRMYENIEKKYSKNTMKMFGWKEDLEYCYWVSKALLSFVLPKLFRKKSRR